MLTWLFATWSCQLNLQETSEYCYRKIIKFFLSLRIPTIFLNKKWQWVYLIFLIKGRYFNLDMRTSTKKGMAVVSEAILFVLNTEWGKSKCKLWVRESLFLYCYLSIIVFYSNTCKPTFTPPIIHMLWWNLQNKNQKEIIFSFPTNVQFLKILNKHKTQQWQCSLNFNMVWEKNIMYLKTNCHKKGHILPVANLKLLLSCPFWKSVWLSVKQSLENKENIYIRQYVHAATTQLCFS